MNITDQAKQDVASGTATKSDTGKPRMSLIAPEFIWALAALLTKGTKKYAPRNWETGMDWDRPADAIERHFNRWKGGEDHDRETGAHHMVAIACNAMFLFIYAIRRVGKDTRVKIYFNREPDGQPDDGPLMLSAMNDNSTPPGGARAFQLSPTTKP
ncbi:MAG: hypothetical protein GC184_06110 [Rhizobiales bacterium]|nr:hypothetical protein [Hyphomicrobiales bacterium]